MKKIKNFLHDQYSKTDDKEINHNYLTEQFSDRDLILAKIKNIIIQVNGSMNHFK